MSPTEKSCLHDNFFSQISEKTNVTTQHISTAKASNKNPQYFIHTQQPNKEALWRAKSYIKNGTTKQDTVIQYALKEPSFWPNNPALNDPINGKKLIISTYEVMSLTIDEQISEKLMPGSWFYPHAMSHA